MLAICAAGSFWAVTPPRTSVGIPIASCHIRLKLLGPD